MKFSTVLAPRWLSHQRGHRLGRRYGLRNGLQSSHRQACRRGHHRGFAGVARGRCLQGARARSAATANQPERSLEQDRAPGVPRARTGYSWGRTDSSAEAPGRSLAGRPSPAGSAARPAGEPGPVGRIGRCARVHHSSLCLAASEQRQVSSGRPCLAHRSPSPRPAGAGWTSWCPLRPDSPIMSGPRWPAARGGLDPDRRQVGPNSPSLT